MVPLIPKLAVAVMLAGLLISLLVPAAMRAGYEIPQAVVMGWLWWGSTWRSSRL